MDLPRWKKFPLKTQMGHITAEIVRAKVWEEKNDLRSREQALERALELVDLTLDCYCRSRRRELARLREVIAHCLVRSEVYDITLEDVQRYGLLFVMSR